MSSPLAIKLAQKLNISIEKVDVAWKKAKISAAASLKKEVSALTGEDFSMVSAITKRMLGVQDKVDVVAFLRSKKPAKEFIEDMVSTGAGIGHTLDTVVLPPKKKARLPQDDEDLSGGTGMYSDDLSGGVGPATDARRKSMPVEDIYENHSKINMADIAGGPNHGPDTGATERLEAMAAGKAPLKTESVTIARSTLRSPITENRSRLDPDELKELMSQPMANPADAMRPATYSIAINESTPDGSLDTTMDDFANDLMNFAETGVSE